MRLSVDIKKMNEILNPCEESWERESPARSTSSVKPLVPFLLYFSDECLIDCKFRVSVPLPRFLQADKPSRLCFAFI